MKQFWQTEDRAMDRLLRGQASQRSGPKPTCKQFDPDLATAYIEHCLKATERESFEQHLSLCAGCRTAVVALARLAEAEAPGLAIRAGQRAPKAWRERLGALAGSMLTPRWAMAATALLVAAVSIPVFISISNNRKESAPLATQQPAGLSGESAKPSALAQETPAALGSGPRSSVDLVAQSPTRRGEQTATPGGTQGGIGSQLPAMTPAPPAIAVNQPPAELPIAAPPSKVEQEEKNEKAAVAAPSPVQSRDQVASAEQAASQQKQLADGDQLAKLDVQTKRPASEAQNDSANVVVLKPGTPYGEERKDVKKTIRPEDSNPPPSPITSAESGRGKGAFAAPASSIHGGQKLSESVRSRGTAERKIGKKRFWLRDDVWTDNDYRPEKEMPMVPIVRDSDVFKELIGKRPSLKGYLTAFAENERAIVVYKGTIYKLIPQQDSK